MKPAQQGSPIRESATQHDDKARAPQYAQQIAPARPSHCSQQPSTDFCDKIGPDRMRLTDRRAKLSQNGLK
jgi:hypothetical protein